MNRMGPDVLAVDHGTDSIKVMRVGISRGKPSVWSRFRVQLENRGEDALRYDYDEGAVAAMLSAALKQHGITPRRSQKVISSLPGTHVFVKQIRMVSLPEEQRAAALVFEARKHVPLTSEIALDYQVLRSDETHTELVLVITSKETLQKHLSMLSLSGLEAGIVDAGALALLNGYAFSKGNESAYPCAVVQVGAATTNIIIQSPQSDVFVRHIPCAGNLIASETTESPGSCPARSISRLIAELQRTLRHYARESKQDGIDSIRLTGGAAGLSWVKEKIEKELKLRVLPFDPFAGAQFSSPLSDQERLQYAQVYCMGLRRLHDVFPNRFK